MIDTYSISDEFSLSIGDAQAKAITKILNKIHLKIINSVTWDKFEDLDQVVSGLAEVKKRAEDLLIRLIQRVDRIEEQLEGIFMNVGYGIENRLCSHIELFVKDVFMVKPHYKRFRNHI